MNLLNEVLDEDKLDLPVTNLYPKTKIPQIFAVGAIEGSGNTPAFRMCSYTSGGDTNKNVKPGEKMVHVVMLTLSDKGSLVKLKNLGTDPVGVISTTFNIVYDAVRQYKMDAVLFRMNKSKVAGQARQLQVIMDRLVRTRTGGKFVILKELWDYDKKYSYILIHRKSVDLSTVPGVPEISTELFTKVESNVGDVFIDKKSGQQVTKSEALAASIAEVNDKRSDQNVIARAKISRRAVAASQSIETNRFENAEWAKYDETAAELNKPATANLVPEANALLQLQEKHVKEEVARKAASSIAMNAFDYVNGNPAQGSKEEAVWNDIKEEAKRKLDEAFKKYNPSSVEGLEAFTRAVLDSYEQFRDAEIAKMVDSFSYLGDEAVDMARNKFNIRRTKAVKIALSQYARALADRTYSITLLRTPKQYTNKEKGAIKAYCGSGYHDINNMLIGRFDPDNYDSMEEDEVKRMINNMDNAFKNGDRLPEGLTLYRAQTIRAPIFEALVKNKVFYFRNYVSTSIYPIIFGGWKSNVAVGLASDNTRDVLNADKIKDPEVFNVPGGQEDSYVEDPTIFKVSVGWAITEADKINVIYPGDLSNMTQEQEVILPRGTMLKINKITNASYSDGIAYLNERFIQASVMTSEQLDESEVVYDGDILLETGQLVEKDKYDFSLFVENTKTKTSNEVMSILASCIDIENIPRRFVD